MKVQDIFQGTLKLISIMGQVLYLRRQTTEHFNPRYDVASQANHDPVHWSNTLPPVQGQ